MVTASDTHAGEGREDELGMSKIRFDKITPPYTNL